MAEWLCLKDYERACQSIGKELEIKSIPNIAGNLCTMCNEIALYLVVVRTHQGIPIHESNIIIKKENNHD